MIAAPEGAFVMVVSLVDRLTVRRVILSRRQGNGMVELLQVAGVLAFVVVTIFILTKEDDDAL